MIDTPIMLRGETPLVTLYRVDCSIDGNLIATANEELLRRRREFAPLGVEWGYLLGCERATTEGDFPLAWQMWDALYRSIAERFADAFRTHFRHSFCKAYRGPVVSAAEGVHYEGLHIDTHPELTDSTDLLRILINVAPTARCFRFGDATRVELARAGLYTDRFSFQASDVEAHV